MAESPFAKFWRTPVSVFLLTGILIIIAMILQDPAAILALGICFFAIGVSMLIEQVAIVYHTTSPATILDCIAGLLRWIYFLREIVLSICILLSWQKSPLVINFCVIAVVLSATVDHFWPFITLVTKAGKVFVWLLHRLYQFREIVVAFSLFFGSLGLVLTPIICVATIVLPSRLELFWPAVASWLPIAYLVITNGPLHGNVANSECDFDKKLLLNIVSAMVSCPRPAMATLITHTLDIEPSAPELHKYLDTFELNLLLAITVPLPTNDDDAFEQTSLLAASVHLPTNDDAFEQTLLDAATIPLPTDNLAFEQTLLVAATVLLPSCNPLIEAIELQDGHRNSGTASNTSTPSQRHSSPLSPTSSRTRDESPPAKSPALPSTFEPSAPSNIEERKALGHVFFFPRHNSCHLLSQLKAHGSADPDKLVGTTPSTIPAFVAPATPLPLKSWTFGDKFAFSFSKPSALSLGTTRATTSSTPAPGFKFDLTGCFGMGLREPVNFNPVSAPAPTTALGFKFSSASSKAATSAGPVSFGATKPSLFSLPQPTFDFGSGFSGQFGDNSGKPKTSPTVTDESAEALTTIKTSETVTSSEAGLTIEGTPKDKVVYTGPFKQLGGGRRALPRGEEPKNKQQPSCSKPRAVAEEEEVVSAVAERPTGEQQHPRDQELSPEALKKRECTRKKRAQKERKKKEKKESARQLKEQASIGEAGPAGDEEEASTNRKVGKTEAAVPVEEEEDEEKTAGDKAEQTKAVVPVEEEEPVAAIITTDPEQASSPIAAEDTKDRKTPSSGSKRASDSWTPEFRARIQAAQDADAARWTSERREALAISRDSSRTMLESPDSTSGSYAPVSPSPSPSPMPTFQGASWADEVEEELEEEEVRVTGIRKLATIAEESDGEE